MKTVIIGNSGSGKTWLANTISVATHTPVIHLDDIFWEPGGFDRKRGESELNALVDTAKAQASWVAEGVFGDLAQKFIADADRLVWLDMHWPICLARLERRGSESKNHLNREQSQFGLGQLIGWAEKYYDRTGACSYIGHRALFDAFPRIRLKFESEADVSEFVLDIQHSAAVGRASAPLS